MDKISVCWLGQHYSCVWKCVVLFPFIDAISPMNLDIMNFQINRSRYRKHVTQIEFRNRRSKKIAPENVRTCLYEEEKNNALRIINGRQ